MKSKGQSESQSWSEAREEQGRRKVGWSRLHRPGPQSNKARDAVHAAPCASFRRPHVFIPLVCSRTPQERLTCREAMAHPYLAPIRAAEAAEAAASGAAGGSGSGGH